MRKRPWKHLEVHFGNQLRELTPKCDSMANSDALQVILRVNFSLLQKLDFPSLVVQRSHHFHHFHHFHHVLGVSRDKLIKVQYSKSCHFNLSVSHSMYLAKLAVVTLS